MKVLVYSEYYPGYESQVKAVFEVPDDFDSKQDRLNFHSSSTEVPDEELYLHDLEKRFKKVDFTE